MKATQIHVSRNGEEIGQYSISEIGRALADGTFDGSESAWHEGLTDWQPIRVVARQNLQGKATSKQREYLADLGVECPADLTKARAAELIQEALDHRETQPTRRQLAELAEFGLACPPDLTRARAAELIQEARDAEQLREKRDSLWEEYEENRRSMLLDYGKRIVPKLTKTEFKEVIRALDISEPGWANGATDVSALFWDHLLPHIEDASKDELLAASRNIAERAEPPGTGTGQYPGVVRRGTAATPGVPLPPLRAPPRPSRAIPILIALVVLILAIAVGVAWRFLAAH